MRVRLTRAALCAALLTVLAVPARAQLIYEITGERALGMAGAFVAVADDATAAHWNPAGLASGGPAGMTIGWYRFQFGDQNQPVVPGPSRRATSFTSLGTMPLGLSFGRFDVTTLVELPDGTAGFESLRTVQYAGTLVQSIIEGLVVGSTLKYLRGEVLDGVPPPGSVDGAFDWIGDVDSPTQGAFDLDLGVMAVAPHFRIGLNVKNMLAPRFQSPGGTEFVLQRQPRLGIAILPGAGLTLAMDLDLDTVDLRGGPRQMFAVGGEALLGRFFAARGGARWNRKGNRLAVGAFGFSVSVRSGMWFDGHYTPNQLDEGYEFGVAMRAGF